MKKFIWGAIITTVLFSSCQKKTDAVDGSNATIVLTNAGTNYVTENITVNPKDSIFFSFTVTSNADMKYVSIQKNPVNQTAFLVRDTLPAASKNSYTAVKKFAADSANGDWIYRIVAHNSVGNYIGHKDIIVSVKPDFNYFTYRFLRVPDTTDKVNTCYMAATTGNVYSYSNGAANSAAIDFGIYYDTTGKASSVTTDDSTFVIYALNLVQPQLPFYDLTAFTKNATIMKKATSPTFASITSAGALRSAAVTNLTSGARNRAVALGQGTLVFFKTAGGKAGCLNVNFVSGSDPSKSTFMNVDVKIEK
jgi:hypothetical protein